MIKAVIFDLGDTLVLNSVIKEKINKSKLTWELFKKNGMESNYEDFLKAEEKARHVYDTEFNGNPKRFEAGFFYEQIGNALGFKTLHKIYAKIDDIIHKEMLKNIQLPEKIFETLEALRKQGIKLAVISNGHRRTVLKKIEYCNLKKYFKHIFISYELGVDKSALTPFTKMAKLLGVKPSECIMVGDRKDEDTYAKLVGMHTILVKYSPKKTVVKKIVEPDFEINKFEEILEIVKNMNKGDSSRTFN